MDSIAKVILSTTEEMTLTLHSYNLYRTTVLRIAFCPPPIIFKKTT